MAKLRDNLIPIAGVKLHLIRVQATRPASHAALASAARLPMGLPSKCCSKHSAPCCRGRAPSPAWPSADDGVTGIQQMRRSTSVHIAQTQCFWRDGSYMHYTMRTKFMCNSPGHIMWLLNHCNHAFFRRVFGNATTARLDGRIGTGSHLVPVLVAV